VLPSHDINFLSTFGPAVSWYHFREDHDGWVTFDTPLIAELLMVVRLLTVENSHFCKASEAIGHAADVAFDCITRVKVRVRVRVRARARAREDG